MAGGFAAADSREFPSMSTVSVPKRLEKLERRVEAVEQILPTLATRDDLKQTVSAAVAPLATVVELHAEIAAAVAPLATKAELREEGERSRRHMDIIGEQLRGDIQLLAEHVVAIMQKLHIN
jgi:uncharacterized protein YicC (UPF0701 family)